MDKRHGCEPLRGPGGWGLEGLLITLTTTISKWRLKTEIFEHDLALDDVKKKPNKSITLILESRFTAVKEARDGADVFLPETVFCRSPAPQSANARAAECKLNHLYLHQMEFRGWLKKEQCGGASSEPQPVIRFPVWNAPGSGQTL